MPNCNPYTKPCSTGWTLRIATCEAIAERPGYPEVAAAALETCVAFMARERTAELRLIDLSWPAP